VPPAEFYSDVLRTADRMFAGGTGYMRVFRSSGDSST
jgi:hypothetical protein